MITKEQYDAAVSAKAEAEKVIQDYGRQKAADFQVRLNSGVPFTDDELRYSRETLCPCGHGLAYPNGCGPHHYWDCSAILKGIADPSVQHTGQLPFTFYDIKSEDETPGLAQTTRGVIRPRQAQP